MKETNHSNLPLQSGELQSEVSGNFFNTVGLTGKDLKDAEIQAGSQEVKILDLMKTLPYLKLTKYEIKTLLVSLGQIKENTPESSISRALTELYKKGQVIKLEEMRQGGLGKPNHLWIMKQDIPQVIESSNNQLDIF